MKPSRKTTDGSDDPWADVVDPVPASGDRGVTAPRPSDEDDPDTAHGGPDDAGVETVGDGDTDTAHDIPADHRPASPADRLADEARKLAEVLVEQLGDVRDEVHDKVVGPLLRRHPDVAAHLGAAGSELMSAYRAFVAARERRWASRSAPTERVALDLDDEADEPNEPDEPDTPREADKPRESGGRGASDGGDTPDAGASGRDPS